jgi:hypothetical protein
MKKVWILAVMAIAFASCSQDQDTPSVSTKGDVALSLTGSTSGMVVTKASVELPAATQVGVYALETAPGSFDVTTTPLKNKLYAATGVAGAFTTTTPLYLVHTKTYQALAYAPYQSSISDDKAVSFAHGADVLYASPANVTISGVASPWSASAALTFVHKMSQVKFTLVSGAGTPDLTGATLKVAGFNESCTMNLADGTITPVKGLGATITEAAKAICFVPNTTDMTLNFAVTTTDGRVYTGTLVKTFGAGNSYAYTVTLNKNETKLDITGTVVDWVNVNGGDIPTEG